MEDGALSERAVGWTDLCVLEDEAIVELDSGDLIVAVKVHVRQCDGRPVRPEAPAQLVEVEATVVIRVHCIEDLAQALFLLLVRQRFHPERAESDFDDNPRFCANRVGTKNNAPLSDTDSDSKVTLG